MDGGIILRLRYGIGPEGDLDIEIGFCTNGKLGRPDQDERNFVVVQDRSQWGEVTLELWYLEIYGRLVSHISPRRLIYMIP